MANNQDIRVRLYKRHDDRQLLADLSDRWRDGGSLRWTTALHSGFGMLTLVCSASLSEAWLYLDRGVADPGRHFAHIEVTSGMDTLYEGRLHIPDIAGDGESNPILSLTALGYWASCRDKRVTTLTYAATTVDAIIKAILTAHCPDIDSDQSGIETVPGTIGLTLSADKYLQDVIISDLAPLGDEDGETYYFAIWEGLKAYYTRRDVSVVDWYAPLSACGPWSLRQSANEFRPSADAYDGTTRTDTETNQDAVNLYGVDRDAVVRVPSGTTAGRASDARDKFIQEHSRVQQESSFTLVKSVRPSLSVSPQVPSLSRIRAGQVIQFMDLAPASVVSPQLDNIRTFYILETHYDAGEDECVIIPDRPQSRLDVLLARQGVEV